MKRVGLITVRLTLVDGEIAAADECCEVSLDCPVCTRRARTVFFPGMHRPAICIQTKHDFPGTLEAMRVVKNEVQYRFTYDYEPFADVKYPDESRYKGKEKRAPTWARVRFSIRCKSCGVESEDYTQSNIGRPYRKLCKCGKQLYMVEAAPELRWAPAKD